MNKRNILFGILAIIVGLLIISFNYLNKKKDFAFNYMNEQLYNTKKQATGEFNSYVNLEEEVKVSNEPKEEVKEEPKEEVKTTSKPKTSTSKGNSYIGYLEIAKIKLKRGFVSKDSKENKVSKNIFIVTTSDYPDVDKGNFILAAHSGNGYNAYFNDLYKLKTGDKAKVTYKGYAYTYQITKIYKQKKTGVIGIDRNFDKTSLTLVTCTNNDNKTQTVYIAELVNKELI